MPDVITAELLENELSALVDLRNIRGSARAAVSTAQGATATAQQNEVNAVAAEQVAGEAVNQARDKLLADLQTFANGG
jgi:hypothetical protein